MADKLAFEEVSRRIANSEIESGLTWLSATFGSRAKFSTSLGAEDQVITHVIARRAPLIEIFMLDTGRFFQETYDVLDLTRKKYDFPIRTYFPDRQHVENLLNLKGPNSFYDSVENRKECCHIRKSEPLTRALIEADVWITGIRAGQSANRTAMNKVEWDEKHQVVKYNPLLDWTQADVEAFIMLNHIPTNVLHKRGYPSIGCAPCTRAIMDGEDVRAGRWWWETSAKECGLHQTNDAKDKT